MPLYSDMYHSYLGSSPISPSYNSYSTIGGYRSNLTSYSRTASNIYPSPVTTLSSYSSRYVPRLAPISETLTARRPYKLNHNRIYTPRPLTINTSEIDVSADRYKAKRIEQEQPPVTNDSESSEFRSTINRNRKVVRINTIRKQKSRSQSVERQSSGRSSCKTPDQVIPVNDLEIKKEDKETIKDSGLSSPVESPCLSPNLSTHWREKVSDILQPQKKVTENKSPGEKFLEKHIIKTIESPKDLKTEIPIFTYPPAIDKGRRSSIVIQNFEILPTFEDICQDISSDNVDDLNACELRKRTSQILDDDLKIFNELRGSVLHCTIEKEVEVEDENNKKKKHKVSAKADITNASISDIKSFVETIKDEIIDNSGKKKPKINVTIEAVEEIPLVETVVTLKKKTKKPELVSELPTTNADVKLRRDSKNKARVSIKRTSSGVDFWGTIQRSETEDFNARYCKLYKEESNDGHIFINKLDHEVKKSKSDSTVKTKEETLVDDFKEQIKIQDFVDKLKIDDRKGTVIKGRQQRLTKDLDELIKELKPEKVQESTTENKVDDNDKNEKEPEKIFTKPMVLQKTQIVQDLIKSPKSIKPGVASTALPKKALFEKQEAAKILKDKKDTTVIKNLLPEKPPEIQKTEIKKLVNPQSEKTLQAKQMKGSNKGSSDKLAIMDKTVLSLTDVEPNKKAGAKSAHLGLNKNKIDTPSKLNQNLIPTLEKNVIKEKNQKYQQFSKIEENNKSNEITNQVQIKKLSLKKSEILPDNEKKKETMHTKMIQQASTSTTIKNLSDPPLNKKKPAVDGDISTTSVKTAETVLYQKINYDALLINDAVGNVAKSPEKENNIDNCKSIQLKSKGDERDKNNTAESINGDNKDIDTIFDGKGACESISGGGGVLAKFPTFNNLNELTVASEQLDEQLTRGSADEVPEKKNQQKTRRSSDEKQKGKDKKIIRTLVEESDSTDIEDEWSEDDEEEKRRRARDNLLLLLRMAKNDDAGAAVAVAQKPAPRPKLMLNLETMAKCYKKDEKAPVMLVAKPKPLWKYVRRNKPHKRRNKKLLERAEELRRQEEQEEERLARQAAGITDPLESANSENETSETSDAVSASSTSKASKSSSSGSDYTEYYDFTFPWYVKDEHNNLHVNSRLSARSIDSGIDNGSETSASLKDPIGKSLYIFLNYFVSGQYHVTFV